jgi:hypothetical protein
MKTLPVTAILLALVLAPALHAAERPERTDRPDRTDRTSRSNPGYSSTYIVIESHNVFVKDRAHIVLSSATQPANNGNNDNARKNPDESFVLTGVVAEGNGYRAYVENLDTSNVSRVGVGDSLHKGHVGAIEMDAIAYDPSGGGQRIWVDIGSDLTGKPSSALSSRAAEESSSPAVSSDIANINPNDPNLTIEQKMKLRRAQQMGTPIPAPGTPGAPGAPGAATQPAGAQPNANPQQQQQQQQPAQAPPAPQPVIVIPPEGFQTGGPQ